MRYSHTMDYFLFSLKKEGGSETGYKMGESGTAVLCERSPMRKDGYGMILLIGGT